jgi:hypothetical protein
VERRFENVMSSAAGDFVDTCGQYMVPGSHVSLGSLNNVGLHRPFEAETYEIFVSNAGSLKFLFNVTLVTAQLFLHAPGDLRRRHARALAGAREGAPDDALSLFFKRFRRRRWRLKGCGSQQQRPAV